MGPWYIMIHDDPSWNSQQPVLARTGGAAMSRTGNGHPAERLPNGTGEKDFSEARLPDPKLEHDGGRTIEKGPYRVRTSPPRNHQKSEISWSSPPLDSSILCTTNAVNLLVWFVYLLYEVVFVREMRVSTGQGLWQVWLAIVAEFSVQLPDMFISLEILFQHIFGSNQEIEAYSYTLVGDVAPTVDVMIPCCGEDPQMIMDTVIAATAQDYPTERYRVFVLDDARSSELEKMVETFKDNDFKQNLPSLTYVARHKRPNIRHYFKAGNLRNGLEVTEKLGQGSEYFAALDADMIAERNWLRQVVPHLILQDDLALACPPQVRSLNQPRSRSHRC